MHLPLPRRPDVILARPAAAVMVTCALVHIVCAVQHWSPALSVVTIAVAVTCLHCVPHLWSAPRLTDWVWVTLGSAAMLALHLIMLAQPAGSGGHHGAVPAPGGGPLDPLSLLGLLLPLVGLGLAWWALGSTVSLGVGVAVDDQRTDRSRDR